MLARRHSLETGAHRYFKLVYGERIEGDGQGLLSDLDGVAGIILVLLPQADHKAVLLKIEQITQSHPNIVVALPRQIDALRGVVEEVACLNWVSNHTEELRDDRVAKESLICALQRESSALTSCCKFFRSPSCSDRQFMSVVLGREGPKSSPYPGCNPSAIYSM